MTLPRSYLAVEDIDHSRTKTKSPPSLEAFGRAVDGITALGVLLIVTYRPEFEPPWIGRPHAVATTVNRLGQREIAAIIARVIGSLPLYF